VGLHNGEIRNLYW